MRIAAHDPEMALAALGQTKLPAGNGKTDWNFQNEANLEFSIASMIVAKNPEAALKLIRASLAHGVTWNAISFLSQLNQKDKKAGQTLYQDIAERLQQGDPSRDPELVNNTWNLLTSFQPPDADEATYKDLLTAALGFMSSLDRETQQGINTAQNLYYQIERIMPLVEKYLPGRASEMRNWSQTVERTLDPQTKMYQEMNKIAQNGTVDDMLALGNKYPPEFQNLLYQSAAWKAVSSGDIARAHEIADMIHDPIQRRQVQDQIEAQAANAAKGDIKIDRARALIQKARNLNRKIELIVQLANQLAANGDNKAALQLLSDGKDLVAAAPQSGDQLSGQLRLAEAYEHVDVDQAFTILQPLTIKLNEFVAAAAVLDGVDFRYFKDGEWEMPGANNLGGFVNSFDRTLSALARHDFDRARKLADQMDRPEMRTVVEIDLAQSVLGKSPAGQAFNGRMNGIIIRNW
jgi:thioredoxin-like negative regulator of GroEL